MSFPNHTVPADQFTPIHATPHRSERRGQTWGRFLRVFFATILVFAAGYASGHLLGIPSQWRTYLPAVLDAANTLKEAGSWKPALSGSYPVLRLWPRPNKGIQGELIEVSNEDKTLAIGRPILAITHLDDESLELSVQSSVDSERPQHTSEKYLLVLNPDDTEQAQLFLKVDLRPKQGIEKSTFRYYSIDPQRTRKPIAVLRREKGGKS